MKRNLIIFGDSQFAERIAKIIQFEAVDEVIGFAKELKYKERDEILGLPVYDFDNLAALNTEFEIIIAIGYSRMNSIRELIYNKCKEKGYKVGTYISKNTLCYSKNIGEGTIMLPGVIIGMDCIIGKCCYIASASTLSHDNYLGDFTFVSTGVAFGGFAKVKDHCFIGINSTIKDDAEISSRTLIGQATNVIKSIEQPDGVYIGSPARRLHDDSSNTKV